jgi:osmotically-inducible protein OsmY
VRQIRISGKNLGQFSLPNACPRCLWLTLHCQNKFPFQKFPGIFSSIDGVKGVENEITVSTSLETRGETTGEKIDDASITAQVKGSLLSHRSTSMLKTKVTTNDGVVTVSGQAKNEAEKALVTKLVTDINGVQSVVNNMSIEPTVPSNN